MSVSNHRGQGSGHWRNERGSTLVEFALVLLIAMTILLGIMEFGRAVWIYGTIAHAAREGTRFAIVRGAESAAPADTAAVRAYVQARAGFGTATQVTTSWQPDNKPGSVVQVMAQYNYQPVLPLVPSGGINLRSTSRMVIAF